MKTAVFLTLFHLDVACLFSVSLILSKVIVKYLSVVFSMFLLLALIEFMLSVGLWFSLI